MRIADESAVSEAEDAAERARRGIGRTSRAERCRAFVEGVLREWPQLSSNEVLRRAKLEGHTGGESAPYGLIASVRPKSVDVLVRFFASRLKYSRLMRVSLVKDETTETLVRHLADYLADDAFGLPFCMNWKLRSSRVTERTRRLSRE